MQRDNSNNLVAAPSFITISGTTISVQTNDNNNVNIYKIVVIGTLPN